MWWFYWDTAWSVILSGVMFATIIAYPDADVRETWLSLSKSELAPTL